MRQRAEGSLTPPATPLKGTKGHSRELARLKDLILYPKLVTSGGSAPQIPWIWTCQMCDISGFSTSNVMMCSMNVVKSRGSGHQ